MPHAHGTHRDLLRRAAAALGALLMGVSLVAGATTPAHAAGGCADRSQNGWTIRLCASKNGLDLISDMYVITKGQTGNGCRGEGHATSSGRPMGYLDLTGCADIAVNTRYVIASQWAAGGAQVTTRAVIFESLSPFRALFDQSASFSDV
ncbi:hypothetical protein [Nonomuraea sp. NPDC049646]|uniref:hypothetical protein n=1 Tax=unclassified Nonomuraea TaxID=2593643 RepID=UPI003790A6B8